MNIEKLKQLYQNTSKHSNYQILPNCLKPFIDTNDLLINSRYEAERLEFLKTQVDFSGKKVVDIGGNTGYFTFQFIEEGAKKVDYIEGNKEHSEFVKFAANDLNLNINVFNNYLNFDDNSEFPSDADIVLLFNVIHHLGDDYGDQTLSMENAKIIMANSINYFHGKTDTLILQMGFCWKGDRNLLLFENGTKEEMIDFVKNAVADKWDIQAIGVAEIEQDKTVFNLLNDSNVQRNDAMGEFRNRPIIILKKKEVGFDKNTELSFLNNLVQDYKDASPYSKIKKDIIIDLITKKVGTNNKYRKALQLGCSNGYETEKLSELFNELTVVDGSSVFIEKLQQQNENKSIKYVFSLFEDIVENTNEQYDIVFCNYILEHVYNSHEILINLKKVLKKDGILFAVVPNANALSRRLAQEMGLIKKLTDLTENDHAHGHRRVYTKDTFMNEIENAGFEILERNGIVFKILADFQLNNLLTSKFLEEKHIWAMQSLAMQEDNIDFSDSFFIYAKNI